MIDRLIYLMTFFNKIISLYTKRRNLLTAVSKVMHCGENLSDPTVLSYKEKIDYLCFYCNINVYP